MPTRIDVAAVTVPIHGDEAPNLIKMALLDHFIKDSEYPLADSLYRLNLRSIKYRVQRVAKLAEQLNIATNYVPPSPKYKINGIPNFKYPIQDFGSVIAIPLRRDKVNYLDDLTLNQKRNVQRISDKLEVPSKDILKEVIKNPEIDDIDDVFITHNINIVSLKEKEQAYNFKLFEFLHQINIDGRYHTTQQDYINHLTALNNYYIDEGLNKYQRIDKLIEEKYINGVNIKNGEYEIALNYAWSTKEVIPHTTEGVHPFYNTPIKPNHKEYGLRVYSADIEFELSNNYYLTDGNFTIALTYVNHKETVTITLHKVLLKNKIELPNGDYKYSFTSFKPTERLVSPTPPYDFIAPEYDGYYTPEVGGKLPIAPFPLSLEVIKGMYIRDAEQLIYISQSLTIYAITETYIHWYETPEFALFLQIVGVVITVISLGSATHVGMTFNAAATAILITLAKAYVFDLVVEWSIEHLDKDEAAAVIIATAFVTGRFQHIDSVVRTITEITAAISEIITKLEEFELSQIQEDYDEFSEFLDVNTSEVERRQKALDAQSTNVTYSLLYGDVYQEKLEINTEETPVQFYDRVLKKKYNDIIKEGYDIKNQFLQLPKKEDISWIG